MQIKMFPEENAPAEVRAAIQRGQVGSIRFAATATSYPHVARALAELFRGSEDASASTASKD